MNWYDKIHWSQFFIHIIVLGGILTVFVFFRYVFSWKRIYMDNFVKSFNQKNYKNAIHYSTKLLKSGFVANDLLYLRALCYFRLNLLNEALIDLSDCFLYEYVEKSKIYFLLGIILSRANEFHYSITFLDRAIKLDGDNPEYRKIRGFVFMKWNKPQEAINDFEYVLKEDSEDHESEVLKAFCEGIDGNKEKSLREFERLIGEFPNDAFIYEYRAALWGEYGMEEEMKKDLNTVFVLKSDSKQRISDLVEKNEDSE